MPHSSGDLHETVGGWLDGTVDPNGRSLLIGTGRSAKRVARRSTVTVHAPSSSGASVTTSDPKADLHRYLQVGRDALLWKLEGLSGYDVRRPLVRTGTNLLGLVKHLAAVESGYFGEVFGRPFPEPMPWFDEDAEPNADMWATADESLEQITGLYRRVWSHADATIDALDLDAGGRVPWWPAGHDEISLHLILVHVTTETHRHAGHGDIVRELIDGAAGLRAGNDNLAPGDDAWWTSYRERLEQVARQTGSTGGAAADA
jgi:uncharacterized damage-inducible protein DinB